ncbi:MAG TPA: TonB-dependent receptor, partial [Pyrinomonadaceae bacterium]|nr:TonB-dependent receptor [Pyrinomonadaceae bacterium]
GTGYWFNRISRFASNGFDNNANGLPKSHFARNQFGYSVGGPVMKNKLFFFSSTEWTRVRSSASQINSVLAPEFLALAGVSARTKSVLGAYSLASNASLGEVTRTAGQLKSQFAVAATDPFFAIPDATPVFRAVRFSVPADVGAGNPQNSYETVARVDYNLSDHTQIYGRLALEKINLFEGSISSSPFAGFNSGETDFNQNWLVNVTHNFTSTLVSQTKLVYNRLNDLQGLAAAPVGPTFFLTNTAFQQIGGHDVAFPGYLPYTPGNGIPFGGPQNLGQAYEDISWTHGNHTVRLGGQYVYIQDNRTFGAYEEATEAIGSNVRGGLNNLVTGNVFQFQAAVFPQGKFPGQSVTLPVGPPDFGRSNRYNDWSLYFNDAWRFTPRLTFNLGVRYEYYGVQKNKNPALDSNFYFGGDGTLSFANIRSGSVQIAQNSPVGGLWRPDRNNFAPRLGFAWVIFGDGRTSVRGGYGRAFERNFGNVTFNVIQNPPNYAVISITTPDVPGGIPISNNNFGPLAGANGTRILPITSLRAVDPNIQNAYADFWSLSLERELMPGTVFSIEYSGSKGHKLYDIANINRVGTGTTYLGSRVIRPDTGTLTDRLNGQYSNINFRGQNGRSQYNGLTFSLESSQLRRTFFKGTQFTARYTWSHAQDNLSTTFSESTNNGSFILGYLDPFNPDLDFGDADFDVRHRFSGSFNWDLPFGNNMTGVGRQVLGGWTLTGIFVARTGTPFSVYDCSFAITICNRMLQVSPDLNFHGTGNPASSGDPNRFNYIDLRPQFPGAGTFFDVSGAGEVGPYPANMTRRNAFRSPGFWNLDFGLYKNIRITEGTRLQLRSEFYNIFNHANLFVSGSDADIVEVDQVQAFRDGRRHIQFAVKLIF